VPGSHEVLRREFRGRPLHLPVRPLLGSGEGFVDVACSETTKHASQLRQLSVAACSGNHPTVQGKPI
jgi:hypothetical protein